MMKDCLCEVLSKGVYEELEKEIHSSKPALSKYSLSSVFEVWNRCKYCYLIRRGGKIVLVIQVSEMEQFYSFDTIWITSLTKNDREEIMKKVEWDLKQRCLKQEKVIWWWGC